MPSQFVVYDVLLPENALLEGAVLTAEKAWDLRRLFDQHLGELLPGRADAAVAFQTCVWEIIHEAPDRAYSVDYGDVARRGDFYVSVGVGGNWAARANSWLAELGDSHPNIGVRILANSQTQDFALALESLGSQPVPEPLTIVGALIGLGLGAVGLRRR